MTIKEAIDRILYVMNIDENGRLNSFEHFHKVFCEEYNKFLKNKEVDIDKLTLHLFTYLASWGMLRGSSFSLNKDYLFHKPVIKILLDKKYSNLLNIKIDDIKEKDILNILEIKKRIKEYYLRQTYYENSYNIKENVVKKKIEHVSETLISKILMGSFSCIFAFDINVKKGLKLKGIENTFSYKAIIDLINFYKLNKKEIDKCLEQINNSRPIQYSTMKLLDMYFWMLGFNN